jgi:uncharacterized protein YegP (UPF0339 family)
MRNSTITYLFGFFFLISCFKAMSNGRSDPNACLEVNGKITNASEGEDGTCTVELICSNTVMASAVLKNGKKKFRFVLHKNTSYTIRISKQGYRSRLVCIDTRLAEADEDLYDFSFETKLLPEAATQNLNKEYLDLPIARVYYDPKKECFVYDKEYTSRIKKEVVMN